MKTEKSVTHTPGPWYYDGRVGYCVRAPRSVYEEAGKSIARAYGPAAHDNAFLIAAAPDLLEAAKELETAARRFVNGLDKSPGYVLKLAEVMRSAIAKAEGR